MFIIIWLTVVQAVTMWCFHLLLLQAGTYILVKTRVSLDVPFDLCIQQCVAKDLADSVLLILVIGDWLLVPALLSKLVAASML